MKMLVIVPILLLVVCPCFAITITVDDDGPADYSNIQDAIDSASDWDVVEVQPGTYYETINFYGKSITVTGSDVDDMGVIYSTSIDGGTAANTVTFDSGEDADSLLTGIMIENGNTGIYCYYSDPTIKKCVVKYANSADEAGIYGYGAQPQIEDCIVRENAGDGIYDCDGQIINCEVRENFGNGIDSCGDLILQCTVADNSGNGLTGCDGNIRQCTVTGNTMGLYHCNGQIKECIVSNNSSTGVNPYDATNVEILNCVVSGNRGNGIVIHREGRIIGCTITGNKLDGIQTDSGGWGGCQVFLFNNIVVNNGDYGISSSGTTITTLKYNNIWNNVSGNYTGLPPGETDTHSNPFFAVDGYWNIDDEWVEGDYHLKSIAGRWTGTNWANDAITSLCIDAGDPTSVYSLETEPNGDRINQGVYGGTIYASKSPYGPEPYCGEHIPYDTNDDCKINLEDFAEWATYWMTCNLVPQSACWE